MSNKKVIIILSIFLISFFSTGLRAAPGTPLTVTINKAQGQADPTNSSPINFVVVFSSSVNDFTNENVAIGGTAGATTAVVTGSNTTYNVAVSGMTRSGTVNASIDAGKAHDADGNPNTASSSPEVIYDITAPTVTITSTATSPTKNSPIPMTATFSETVTGFLLSGIKVGNGAASNLQGSGTVYTFDVTPSGQGTVTVDIPASTAKDLAGNGNTAATQFSIIYDSTQPTVTITSTATSPTKNSPIPMTATFSKNVIGFSLSNITVGNGAKSNLQGSGTVYTFDVTPSGQGTVTVDIPAGAAQDAAGNGNTAAKQFSIIYDSMPPAISITSPADGQVFTISSITVSGTASDNDLNKIEVKVGNGAWQAVSGTSWSTQVNLSEGPNTIYALATDTAGNTNETSINVTLDTIAPDPISNPQAVTAVGSFYINNTWVNPTNVDFSYVWFKYSNGTELQKVYSPTNYLNLKWPPHYTQTISARTVDKYGNINPTLVWFNATIPNNPPVQAPIGNKEIYKGQLLTFGISTTDADSDTITYGTNATKGSLNSSTGVFTWTPEDSDAGEYIWEFNSSDGYGGVDSKMVRINVINPLDIDLKFIEPYITFDNGTWNEAWRNPTVGHPGKLIGYNSTFKNVGNTSLTITVTEIYNNETRDGNSYPVTLANNESKSCPDGVSRCRFAFEINSTGVKDGLFNFTLQTRVKGYKDSSFIFNYTNFTTISLPIIPISRIKQADASIVIVSEGRTTTITYTLEANSTVNLTNISISDPLFQQTKLISRLESVGNTSRCYDEKQNPISCILSFKYPVTTQDISKFKSEESELGYPYIINMATLTAKTESGNPINDTDYVKICVNKCYIGEIPSYVTGSSSGGGGGSSGGGGGGGAPASSEDFNNIEAREVREMDVYAKLASTYVFKSADPVMVVAFESSSSENGVPVAVEVLKNRSKFIGDSAPGKPYKYFNVFVGTSGFSQKVSKGVIAYRVNNSWLAENNIDPADISLYKWRGTWVRLDTQIAESRSNYTYYASLTGNFSSFAIAAAKDKKIGGAYASDIPMLPEEQQNTTQAIANLSGDGPKHKIPGLSAATILVFGIAGVILYLKRNHKKFNRDVRK